MVLSFRVRVFSEPAWPAGKKPEQFAGQGVTPEISSAYERVLVRQLSN
jgi:hypothetical protein